MTIAVYCDVRDARLGDMHQKIVMLALGECANDCGGGTSLHPSDIARQYDTDVESIEAALFALQERGLIWEMGEKETERGKIPVWQINLRTIQFLGQNNIKIHGGGAK